MSKKSTHPRLKTNVLNVSRALAIIFAAAPCFAQSEATAPVNLGTVSVTSKKPSTLEAAESAPSQGNLDARSAQSVIGDQVIRDYTTPAASYTQVLSMSPGAFSYSPNGEGLGDSKVTIRGMGDGNSVISFDGIPFNDTNGVSHHAWVFFPSQFMGGAVVDRGPGSAATIGQAAFGGNIDLKSRVLEAERRTSITGSTGTWSTRLVNLEHETGQFGANGDNNLLVNVHEMKSDGYQTYNQQDRTALSAKFQHTVSADTTLTVFTSYLDLKNNTANIKGVTRTNVDNGIYNQLLTADPARSDYYGYNFYSVQTDFSYIGFNTMLAGGWKLEDKLYRYSYHNKQNYDNGSKCVAPACILGSSVLVPSPTSAVDKLNAYTTFGNLLRASRESDLGTLRTGLWIDRADSHRYQIKSDPRTWVDVSAPNFSESYTTTTIQPYVEHEFKLNDKLKFTPGLKYASYTQDFTHLQDNGGAVGFLGGTLTKNALTGGAASISNSITYTDWLPSLDLHYAIQPNWTAYAQYAYGDQIPDTGVFDVTNAAPAVTPKPILAKTLQVGTVWNTSSMTLSGDVYHTQLDSTYTGVLNATTGVTSWTPSGTQINQGLEGEANFALGGGFSVYTNATLGSLKYDSGIFAGKWVSGAPRDTEALGLNYQRDGWAANLQVKRIGEMYNDGKLNAPDANNNTAKPEGFTIDPVVVSNLFVNYTVKTPNSFAKSAKISLGVSNLFDKHSVVGIAGVTAGSTSANPSAADLLTVLAGRSINLSATLSF